VLAGTNSLSSNNIRIKVQNCIIHENYQLNNVENNLAVLRLETPLKFSESIKPIELFSGEMPVHAPVVIAGWGRTAFGGYNSDFLRCNILNARKSQDCAIKTGITFNGVLCLDFEKGNGACNVSCFFVLFIISYNIKLRLTCLQCDNGGAAVYNKKLVGIILAPAKGCGYISPDVYSKISYFAGWIRNTVKRL
jgi:trypsin